MEIKKDLLKKRKKQLKEKLIREKKLNEKGERIIEKDEDWYNEDVWDELYKKGQGCMC